MNGFLWEGASILSEGPWVTVQESTGTDNLQS